MNLIRSVARALAAVLLVVLGPSASPAVAVPESQTPVASVPSDYDGTHHSPAPVERTRMRRRPAAADCDATAVDAVHPGSQGAVARPRDVAVGPTTTYASPTTLAATARATTTTARRAVVAQVDLSVVDGRCVAAKSVDETCALVRYDPMAASRNILGQVGEGYARTPMARPAAHRRCLHRSTTSLATQLGPSTGSRATRSASIKVRTG